MTMCVGKIRYRTMLEAKIVLSRIDRGNKEQERYFYECLRCRGWHLTKMEQRDR